MKTDVEEHDELGSAPPEVGATDAAKGSEAPRPPRKRKRKRIIVGVCIVIVALAAVAGGFTAFANTSGYCMVMCHTPLSGYTSSFDQNADVEGTDKWGNEVSDTTSMLAVTHRDWNAATCETCHPQDLNYRLSEFTWWAAGDYYYPLEEWKYADMEEYYGVEEDQMCLNEACHNISRDDLLAETNDTPLNPHSSQHGQIACGSCHKAHRASVMYCAKCHDEAVVPDGWITPDQEKVLLKDEQARLYGTEDSQ